VRVQSDKQAAGIEASRSRASHPAAWKAEATGSSTAKLSNSRDQTKLRGSMAGYLLGGLCGFWPLCPPLKKTMAKSRTDPQVCLSCFLAQLKRTVHRTARLTGNLVGAWPVGCQPATRLDGTRRWTGARSISILPLLLRTFAPCPDLCTPAPTTTSEPQSRQLQPSLNTPASYRPPFCRRHRSHNRPNVCLADCCSCTQPASADPVFRRAAFHARAWPFDRACIPRLPAVQPLPVPMATYSSSRLTGLPTV